MSRTDLLPGVGPVLTLRQANYRAGRDYRGGITSLAYDMGLDVDALQKKLHIENEQRWLKPEEQEDILRITRDTRLPADSHWLPHEVETLRYHANLLIGQVLGIVAGAELAMLEAVTDGEVCHG